MAAPLPGVDVEDRSRAYAGDLHKLLLKSRVPHKIATIEFTYFGDAHRVGLSQRTVVVYRDATRRGEGWWLMDERLKSPVWLPDKPLDQQLSFYLARPVTIINVSDFTGSNAAKIILPPDRGAPRKTGTSTIQRVDAPAPKSERGGLRKTVPSPSPATPAAQTKIAPIEKPAPKPVEKKVTVPVKKKPVVKTEAPPTEKKITKPVEKPAVEKKTAEKAATVKPVEKAAEQKPKVEEKKDAKATPKAEEKKEAKPAAKADEKAKPVTPEKPAEKSPEKKEKPVPAPASKAEPTGKTNAKPLLFDKRDETPQATIISEDGAPSAPKDRDPADRPKPAADAPKTSFFKRLFRRFSRA